MIERHLEAWLGAWPGTGFHVVASERRDQDGVLAVLAPDCGVLSVSPRRAARLDGLPVTRWRGEFPGLAEMVFRYTCAPAPLADAGVWVSAHDPALPAWLRPFGGDVLAALEGGEYRGAAALKRHDAYGHEIAVGIAPSARGRGLARRLVAQAARSVLARGGVPTYVHGLDNLASARVADAAGFPDRGWRILRPS